MICFQFPSETSETRLFFVWSRHCVLVMASIYPTGHFFYIVHLLCAVAQFFKEDDTASSCPGGFSASIWDAHSPFWFLTVGRLLGFSLASQASRVTMPLPPFHWVIS
jgi:hypothetical protein